MGQQYRNLTHLHFTIAHTSFVHLQQPFLELEARWLISLVELVVKSLPAPLKDDIVDAATSVRVSSYHRI